MFGRLKVFRGEELKVSRVAALFLDSQHVDGELPPDMVKKMLTEIQRLEGSRNFTPQHYLLPKNGRFTRLRRVHVHHLRTSIPSRAVFKLPLPEAKTVPLKDEQYRDACALVPASQPHVARWLRFMDRPR